MKSFSNDRLERLADLRTRLENSHDQVVTSVGDWSLEHSAGEAASLVSSNVADHNQTVELYNLELRAAVAEIQAYIDGKHWRWQESDRGEAFVEWVDSLESAEEEWLHDPVDDVTESEVEDMNDTDVQTEVTI